MRGIRFHLPTAAVLFLVTLLLMTTPLPAQAQTFKVLHTFRGPDGGLPEGVLVLDKAGNIYGTASAGGSGKCGSPFIFGCGTGFMLSKAGQEVGQVNFGLSKGFGPRAGLVRDVEGNFYGTTFLGGDTTCYQYGCGTVYKVSKTGRQTALYEFKGPPDGDEPESLLVEDTEGNLYGTTYTGGAYQDAGTVFEIDGAGNETILYNFCSQANCTDGQFPDPGVIRDGSGNLYGVASAGGDFGAGVVYELDTSGKETVLYSFTGGSDGDGPYSTLLRDSQGNLYGTTQGGGILTGPCSGQGAEGCGVVFEVSLQPGGTWKETTLYRFCSLTNCADGETPLSGPLVRDVSGNLYGTTTRGGSFQGGICHIDGCGVVFELDTAGKETVLHTFTGGTDGANPWAGLTADGHGNLYGTAQAGADTQCFPPDGCGVVFKISR